MKKILLVNPSIPDTIKNKDIWVPINLMYIGAVLKREGFYVEIIDLNICKGKDAVMNRIEQMMPDIVGITSIFSGQFSQVCSISEMIKNTFEDIVIAIGGIHPTIYAQKILEHYNFIDWIVLGEGEYSFLEIIKTYTSGDLSAIDGICYRHEGRVVINEKKEFIKDLDELPFPDYSLIKLSDYKIDTFGWHNPRGLPIDYMIPILSSRSCPMRCNFCSMFLAMGSKQRFRSPEKVVDEIEYLYNKYGCRRFAFTDDNLTLRKSHIKKICEEIIDRGLIIQFETPNGISLAGLDEEVVALMVKAGLIRVSLAIESGSEYIRNKIIGKHLKTEKIFEVIKLFEKYSEVYIKAFFIIGMPEDTIETLEETYRMIGEINVDHPCVSNLLPFPGTKLFKQVVEDDLLIDGINADNLWNHPDFYFTDNKNFFLKPYDMEMSELNEFRKKIDILVNKIVGKSNDRRTKA